MNKRLLLDTNILLDAAMPEREGWAAAAMLIDEFAYENVDGYVCATSLKDIYYVLTKYDTEASARDFILAILDLFEVVSVDKTICRIAARSDELDFEDGIIRACAESVPVDFIISRDKRAFSRSTIRRIDAQEYLDTFCEVEKIKLA